MEKIEENYDKFEELPGEKKEAMIIHKRLLTNENETLCKSAGAKIYLSSRVTCPDCQKIMEHNSDSK